MRGIFRSLRRTAGATGTVVALSVGFSPVVGAATGGTTGAHHLRSHAGTPTLAPLKWASQPSQVDTALPFANTPADPHPVSCPTSSLCVMANGGEILTTTNPQGQASSWYADYGEVVAGVLMTDGAHPYPDTGNIIEDVSCAPGTGDCVAVDNVGNVLTATSIQGSQNTVWSPQDIDGTIPINSITCPTTSFCVAVDAAGNVLTSTGPFPLNQVPPFAAPYATYSASAPPIEGVTPLTVLTSSLPEGIAGTAYAGATLVATGGKTPYTWALAGGTTLPAGLTLAAGAISGTPTTPGTYTFTVKVTDASGNTAQANLTLTVIAATTAYVTITTNSIPPGIVGTTYSTTFTDVLGAGGTAPVTWSIAAGATLPTGCLATSLSATTGTFSCTPKQTGTFSFTVNAQDSSGTPLKASGQFILFIPGVALTAASCPTSSFCAAGTASGTILTCNTSVACATGAWSSTSAPVDAANPLTVLTSNLPDGVQTVAYPAGVSMTATGGSPLPAGSICSGGGASSTQGYCWSWTAGPAPAPSGCVPGAGTPTGLAISAAGTISGTPTAAGCYWIQITATDGAAHAASEDLAFTVAPPPPTAAPLTIATTCLPLGTVTVPYTFFSGTPSCSSLFTATGGTGPDAWKVAGGTPPPGLSFTGNSFGGVPTVAGTYVFTVEVTDSTLPAAGGPLTASGTFVAIVSANVGSTLVPSITSISCPSSSLCEATDNFGNILTSTNPIADSTAAWTTIDQDSSGKPLEVVDCPTVSLCAAGDAHGNVLHGTSLFNVSTPGSGPPPATVGTSYTGYLSAADGAPMANGSTCSGGGSPSIQGYCWTVTQGAQQLQTAGLTISSAGVITGLPAIAGTYLVTVEASDGSSPAQTATTTLPITIDQPATGLTIDSSSLPPDAVTGETYLGDLGTVGGSAPFTWTVPGAVTGICTAPSVEVSTTGMCVSPNGLVSGIPSVTGTVVFTAEVSDSSSPVKTQSATIQIIVTPALSWSAPVGADPRSGANQIESLSCATFPTLVCLFADSGGAPYPGGSVEFSTNPGSSSASAWTTAANQITALSCPASGVCVAADAAGNLLSSVNPTLGGVLNWPIQLSANGGNLVTSYANGITCDPQAVTCMIVNAAHDSIPISAGGALPPWKSPIASAAINASQRPLDAVSCPSSTVCIAADAIGHVVTLSSNGGAFAAGSPKGIGTVNPLTGISCPSLNLCAAVDNAGNVMTSTDPAEGTNATWALASHVDGNREIDSISCAVDPSAVPPTPATLCVAVDASGNVLFSTDPGAGASAWTLTSGVDSIWFNSVSCPTTTFCAAADGEGQVFVSGNPTQASVSAWTSTMVDKGESINAISCATNAMCVAADVNGQVISGTSSSVTISVPGDASGVFDGAFPASATVGTAFPTVTTDTQECSTAISTGLKSAMCATGGTAPYTWSISAGSLPPGLCLYPQGTVTGACPTSVSNNTSQVAGTPTATGTFAFTVQVTDSSTPPQSATLSGTVVVTEGTSTYAWMEDGNSVLTPSGAGTALSTGTALAVLTTNLPQATNGVAYSASLTAAGGTGSGYTWTLTSGTLPTGLALSGGTISGTPTGAGANPLKFKVTDSASDAATSGNLTLTFHAAPATNTITTTYLPPASLGVPYSATINATSNTGAETWTSTGSLPAGLSLDTACTGTTCTVTGTPTAIGSSTFTVTATDTVPTAAAASFTIAVTAPQSINSISCNGIETCVVGDDMGNTFSTQTAASTTLSPPVYPTFTAPPAQTDLPPPSATTNNILAISCPSVVAGVTLCAAGDQSGDLLTSLAPTTPGGWCNATAPPAPPATTPLPSCSATTGIDSPNKILGISCPTTTLCVAVDSVGNIFTTTNADAINPTAPSWTKGTIDPGIQINAISCPTTTLCVAVDNNGGVLWSPNPSGGAATWTSARVDFHTGSVTVRGVPNLSAPLPASAATSMNGLTGVSCSSNLECVAVDAAGNVVTSTHPTGGASAWTLAAVDNAGLTGVSCPLNATFCMAVDSQGNYVDTNNPVGGSNAWSSPTGFIEDTTTSTNLDAGVVINAIDCPSVEMCLATDQTGNVLIGIPNQGLTILSSILPAASVGQPYSEDLTAIGGTAPYSWALPAGSPKITCTASPGSIGLIVPGLCLNPTTGTITGTPTAPSGTPPAPPLPSCPPTIPGLQPYCFGVIVTDSSSPPDSAVTTVSVTVIKSTLAVTTTSLPTAYLDTEYTAIVSATGGAAPYSWSIVGGLLPTGLLLSGSGTSATIFGKPSISGTFSMTLEVTDSSASAQSATAALTLTVSKYPNQVSTQGYWLAGSNGVTFPFGSFGCPGGAATPCLSSLTLPADNPSTCATFLGSQSWIAGMAPTADNRGYWLVASDGGVYASGDASYLGGANPGSATVATNCVVGIAATPDGKGYWLADSAGKIYPFGSDAGSYGDTSSLSLRSPVVGIAATPDGHGYWLVGSDGGVFAFGDAGFHGSTGQLNPSKPPGGSNSVAGSLAAPVVAVVSTPDGGGYWLAGADGAVFAFGDAGFFGSVPGVLASLGAEAGTSIRLASPIISMVATPDGGGYWMIGGDGGVFTFGDATFLGSQGVGAAVPPAVLPSGVSQCNPPFVVGRCQIVGGGA